MLRIIKYEGGLGNQMFQYAFYLALQKKHPFSLFLFDTRNSLYCHNGYELSRIFKKISRIKERIFYILLYHFPSLLKICRQEKEKVSLKYDDSVYKKSGCIEYKGFWQTDKYFKSIRNDVLKTFQFETKLINKKTRCCVEKINAEESVSIHIRRGDYIQEPFRLTCDDDYYNNAIAYIKSKIPNPHFYVFSDDQDYVKSLFQLDNVTFVDWNQETDSWQDMYLMSKCNHNIIANSSFSWWGAWLNDNPGKIVIAPKLWFEGSYNEDIVPNSWQRI